MGCEHRSRPFELLVHHGEHDRIAFAPHQRARTLMDLRSHVAALASMLPESHEHSHALVFANDRYAFTVAMLAAWLRGHAVALPPNGQSQAMTALRSRDEIVAMLHDTDQHGGIDVRSIVSRDVSANVSMPLPFRVSPQRLLVTLFTSGSTGEPRPIRKHAHQLIGEAELLVRTFELAGADIVATVPAHHIYGLLLSVLVPLVGGGAFCCTTPLFADAIAESLLGLETPVLVSVPAHLRVLEVLEPQPATRGVRTFSSGAPLPDVVASMLHERLRVPPIELLGSTETGGIAWRNAPEMPFWIPLPGIRVGQDPTGRMLLDSPFLASTEPQPFTCADCIELVSSEPTRFRHMGRADDVVKVAGKRVSTLALEHRLRTIEGIEEAVVIALPRNASQGDPDARGQRLAAVLVGRERPSSAIRAALEPWFDPVVIPRMVYFVDHLPRTERGKLARDQLLGILAASTGPEKHAWQQPASADLIADNATWFEGHFPHRHVLPAIVQLVELVLPMVHRHWPELDRVHRLLRLKFIQPIAFGEVLSVALQRRAVHRVGFRITRAGETCSSGVLEFSATPFS